MEVWEIDVLVEVLFRALHFIRFGAASAAHQVGNPVDFRALVVVNRMARDDDDGRHERLGAVCARNCAQSDLIGARVVIDMNVGLECSATGGWCRQ